MSQQAPNTPGKTPGARAVQASPQGAKPAGARPPGAKPLPIQTKPKKGRGKLIFGIFIILLIATPIALIYFDIAGARQMTVTTFKLNIPTQTQLDDLNAKTKEYEIKMAELAAREQALNAKANELASKEQTLLDRETAQANKQAELDALDAQLQGKAAEAKTISGIVENMGATQAAVMLSNLPTAEEIASVLINISSEKAALIMDKMDAKLAMKVIASMLIN